MWNVLTWYSLELRMPRSILQIGLLANVLRIASWLSVSGTSIYRSGPNRTPALRLDFAVQYRRSCHSMFQGQEAPIAIYSIATSSHADAPRGMAFLDSANRLNVAISRARRLAVLVASPDVFEAECRTPRQMQLANAFCRYMELASPVNL